MGLSNKNILWRTKLLKQGSSSPVIWSNRIFLSGADDKARTVYCYDADTGNLLWQKDAGFQVKEMPKVSEDAGWAASSPVTDGTHVIAIFATGELICLDFSGNIIWRKKLDDSGQSLWPCFFIKNF